MAVRAYSPVLPSVELFGAYEGIASATGVNETVSLTFTPTSEGNLTVVPYDGDANISQMQLEAASTPSSYIPTPEGATATRAADVLTIPAANLPWPEPVVIGDELVTNGAFDSDYSGWDDANVTANGGSVSVSSGEATVTRGTSRAEFYQIISTEVGKVYAFTGDVTAKTGTASWWLGTSRNNASNLNKSGVSVGTTTGQFTATATSTYVTFVIDGAEGVTGTIDNVSVREINPLAVSIQMDGKMTYADTNPANGIEVLQVSWELDANNRIQLYNNTGSTRVGDQFFLQRQTTVQDFVGGANNYSPGTLVPFNIASRHGSTFINGAVDGVALTENTTPTALPDLSSTDLQLGYDFMGTIKTFRVWADDLGNGGIEEASQ